MPSSAASASAVINATRASAHTGRQNAKRQRRLRQLASLYQACSEFPRGRDSLLRYIDTAVLGHENTLDSSRSTLPRAQTLNNLLINEKAARNTYNITPLSVTEKKAGTIAAELETDALFRRSARSTSSNDFATVGSAREDDSVLLQKTRSKMQAIMNALHGNTHNGQPGLDLVYNPYMQEIMDQEHEKATKAAQAMSDTSKEPQAEN